jgi:hypothetical protein
MHGHRGDKQSAVNEKSHPGIGVRYRGTDSSETILGE